VSDEWPIAGNLLAARYRLVTLLETGGMAQIWRADDELLARPVAVKLPKGSQVVWREARMAAKLQHPNIAAVHDYREAVRADGTVAPFVVMELLAGESVAARLEREPIELPEAARIGAAVADALAAAHANGVVHRDIKPGNVMLTPTGVKILDFGISATAGEPDDDESGSTFGTPAYVAPERLDGMPAEPATDVYGLGVLLFEMVTGDPPYPVDTWEELAAARATGPTVLPPDLPKSFRTLVGRCLAEDPADRPGADEVRFDLTALWLKPELSDAAPLSGKDTVDAPAARDAPSAVAVAAHHGGASAARLRPRPGLRGHRRPHPAAGEALGARRGGGGAAGRGGWRRPGRQLAAGEQRDRGPRTAAAGDPDRVGRPGHDAAQRPAHDDQLLPHPEAVAHADLRRRGEPVPQRGRERRHPLGRGPRPVQPVRPAGHRRRAERGRPGRGRTPEDQRSGARGQPHPGPGQPVPLPPGRRDARGRHLTLVRR
jgi:hypothetical protein